jgi:nucleotide-binding universal stress UspA family protein
MSTTLPVIAAVDGSDDSLRALDWAFDAAHRREAPLRVVHVRQYAAWAQAEVLVAGPPDTGDDPLLDQAREHLRGRAYAVATEYVGMEGVPGAVLPELGADAQLLVLGSRGRGGFASLLLGSNGMAAARDAECPAVVVPRPPNPGPGWSSDCTWTVPTTPRSPSPSPRRRCAGPASRWSPPTRGRCRPGPQPAR